MRNDSVHASSAEIDRLAYRRACAKMRWFTHATLYVAVTLSIAVVHWYHGSDWRVAPTLGWGLAVVVHGVRTWFWGPRSAWHTRLIQRERARLCAPRWRW